MYEVHLASSLYVTFVCVEQCGTMWNMLFMLPSSCHASHQLEDSNVSHLQSYSSVFSSRLFFSPTKRALRILAEIFRLMFFQTEWNGKNMETSNHLESILKISKLSSKKMAWFWNFASEISKGGRCYPWAGDPQCEELEVKPTEGMFVGGFFQGKHPKTCFFCRSAAWDQPGQIPLQQNFAARARFIWNDPKIPNSPHVLKSTWLGGGFNFFSLPGEMILFDLFFFRWVETTK